MGKDLKKCRKEKKQLQERNLVLKQQIENMSSFSRDRISTLRREGDGNLKSNRYYTADGVLDDLGVDAWEKLGDARRLAKEGAQKRQGGKRKTRRKSGGGLVTRKTRKIRSSSAGRKRRKKTKKKRHIITRKNKRKRRRRTKKRKRGGMPKQGKPVKKRLEAVKKSTIGTSRDKFKKRNKKVRFRPLSRSGSVRSGLNAMDMFKSKIRSEQQEQEQTQAPQLVEMMEDLSVSSETQQPSESKQ